MPDGSQSVSQPVSEAEGNNAQAAKEVEVDDGDLCVPTAEDAEACDRRIAERSWQRFSGGPHSMTIFVARGGQLETTYNWPASLLIYTVATAFAADRAEKTQTNNNNNVTIARNASFQNPLKAPK